MARDDYSQLHVTVLRITAKAILVRLEDNQREAWIPQSQVFEDDLAEMDVGVVMEINVKTWFCAKEDLT